MLAKENPRQGFAHPILHSWSYGFVWCIIQFETGERDDTIGRVHDLMDTVDDK